MGTATTAPAATDGRLYGSTADVMARYGFKRTTLYELLSSGTIPSRKIGGRLLIRFGAVEEYIAGLPTGTRSAEAAEQGAGR